MWSYGKIHKDSLAAGLIHSLLSSLETSFFFVEKKDKSLHPCIDYQGLNPNPIKNKYPLPLIDSEFEPLVEAVILTKLDLRNAYYLIPIKEGDWWRLRSR